MNDIEVFNEQEKEVPEIEKIKPLLLFALEKEKVTDAELSVILVTSERIREINKLYRGIDKETDVISFALEDEKEMILISPHRMLGDIYICLSRAEEQAKEYGHSFTRELCFLSVHGLLHLLGYDHIQKEEEKIMIQKQKEILDAYGIFKTN